MNRAGNWKTSLRDAIFYERLGFAIIEVNLHQYPKSRMDNDVLRKRL